MKAVRVAGADGHSVAFSLHYNRALKEEKRSFSESFFASFCSQKEESEKERKKEKNPRPPPPKQFAVVAGEIKSAGRKAMAYKKAP